MPYGTQHLMTMNIKTFILLVFLCATAFSCKNKGEDTAVRTEDLKAKQLFQGIWVDSDEENVVFKVKGDTIYYPDSLSQPIKFAIYGDTLELKSANDSKYAILKQSAHIFEFKNSNGDIVKLIKGEDPSFELQFANKKPTSVNQNKTIKSDTILFCNNERYHSYIQVNPTTYKVLKTSYNDDGLEIESVYFDNTIHLGIFKQETKIFSKDFKKSDFTQYVPKDFLKQSVLSDLTAITSDNKGFHYIAELAIPDSYVSYMVNIVITTDGKISMNVTK